MLNSAILYYHDHFDLDDIFFDVFICFIGVGVFHHIVEFIMYRNEIIEISIIIQFIGDR